MLEKIGLPPKPSLRGNVWVVDASHCQSCSSQFTFLNRKHHCRRCGGLFCNSCTNSRIVLRGQGDSPVRICEACKKLEECARFELRHGHKNRAGKGTSKLASRSVDEVMNEILVNDGKESARMGSGKEIISQDEDVDHLGNASNSSNNEMDSVTPEDLRQQALDEKNNYKILKGEGKSVEALKAFKRARELERQAGALELQLRKDRKKALVSASVSASKSLAETQINQGTSPELGTKSKSSNVKEKDDLAAELKELGWSDVDINDAKKPAPTSLEGELFNLIQDSGETSRSKVSSSLDKTQVIALKKKALLLKREGKLAEAKEELKKAKFLEKQLEEQEFLADGEESDDELSALMRSLDKDEKKELSGGFGMDSAFDLNNLSVFGGDLNIDDNFEVTDDDIHDPEMAAALQSLGWTEEPIQFDDVVPNSTFVDREAVSDEILKLKKEAVTQKRSGNLAEAMSLLKRAKALEKEIEKFDSSPEKEPESSGMQSRTSNIIPNTERKPPVKKSRLMIQKELLALKKKALALRREGKLEEADSELKKGKVLEQQLEEMDNPAKLDTQMNVGYEVSDSVDEHLDLSSSLAPEDEQGDVTEQDLLDPAYLSLLKNLGWQDEDNNASVGPSVSVESRDATSGSVTVEKRRRRSKGEIQRELLGLKRKALTLRRQGQETEADEMLETAKKLEEELAELEAPKTEKLVSFSETEAGVQGDLLGTCETMEKRIYQTPLKRPAEANDASEKRQVVQAANPSPNVSPDTQKSPVQQEILTHKRKALALKKEGKVAEAKEELRKAKLLERNLEDDKDKPINPLPVEISSSSVVSVTESEEHKNTSTSTQPEEQDPARVARKPMSTQERLKLQRECLKHKRNGLKLRREGKTEEADAELELAKKLEAQLEEVSPVPTSSNEGPIDDAGIEDLFDPQLLSALKAVGLQDDAHVVSQTTVKAELPTSSSIKNESFDQERVQMEALIKAEKVKALNLKRSGKQAEALDALRRAKQMEKKLTSLPS
ncbi:hypothetical protein SOVF_205660 [Spinacia oleracea]|uniref:FYVE-type domain-containing protein n=1 Tax=Spinacia oleracea TaxID=3562 RepID=A0A9R0IYP7_SPIOL|nr:uncharacterized protein LOC110797238 [Spinacia oleracea]KNA03803.1 hypothetical protein SOVF_205660 [Spinacia oleracea]